MRNNLTVVGCFLILFNLAPTMHAFIVEYHVPPDVSPAIIGPGEVLNIGVGGVGADDIRVEQGGVVNVVGGLLTSPGMSEAHVYGEVNVYSGGTNGVIWVYDTGVLNVHDGNLRGYTFVTGGTLNVYDGYPGAYMGIYNGATVNINGGEINDLETFNSTWNVYDGTVQWFMTAAFNVTMNIFGGNFPSGLNIGSGSIVNISGGELSPRIEFSQESELNISATSILLNGEPIPNFGPGQEMEVSQRNVTLSGVFLDGTHFAIELNDNDDPYYFIHPLATVRVTLVPEPQSLVLILLCAILGASRISRT